MPHTITESEIEEVALEILSELNYDILHGPDIAPDGSYPERQNYSDVVLVDRLKSAIHKFNPSIPREAREEAMKKVLWTESPSLIINNHTFHKMLVDGIDVEYRKEDSSIAGDKVWLFDFQEPKNNEFLAVNQFTVIENNNNRRPDIILFINGLPLVLIELKNPADENATITTAYNQFETYKQQIPSLFHFNEILVVSDGTEAQAGTITSGKEWFLPWKTLDGTQTAPASMPQLEVLLKGMFDKRILLDLIRHFIVYEQEHENVLKKLAAYHQYHAVNKAIETTITASGPQGNRRCGVVWHTQGSGKSLSMAFYTGKLVLTMDNPTIVVLTDRNDLDDQLFGTFSSCQEILRQQPVQADTRDRLQELLQVSSGGVVFTTIQKFLPEKGEEYPTLSDRRNIIVIADEAHRTQYGLSAKIITKGDQARISYGFAKHMRDTLPNASFIGFTGTLIELGDKSTPAIFGNYIDIYDVEQAVTDGATVRIFYESRLAKLELSPEERPKIDSEFEDVTENEEVEKKEKLKSKWARLEAVVGSEKRIQIIAKDIVDHFEKRLDTLEGKGMIVCMSRRICVELHKEIVKLKPEWYHQDDDKGFIKVIMTGSASDDTTWQEHIRNKPRRRALADRMKDPDDDMNLAIVRDMWLTGFDAPSLHTMYIDKPMRSHGLMQAIARVNRVFKDKPGGLVVDYLGIATDLKKAMSDYSKSGGRGDPTNLKEEAVAIMLEKHEIICELFHGFDYQRFFTATPREKMFMIPAAMNYILQQEEGAQRCIQLVAELSKAFALAVPHEETDRIRDEVGFFQAVKAGLVKTSEPSGKPKEELDSAIRQIIPKAIVSDEVIDIFDAVGLKKPDISILSEEFLAEVKGMEHKNLAFEVLKKLLNDETKTRSKRNLIQGHSFAEMLEKSINNYKNKNIETAQVIEELIELARKMREAKQRGEELKLTEAELAFYDALEVNDSAVKVLGDEILRDIARELTENIRNNISIDWTLKESVQAKMRVIVKRILKKYGYPPDKQKKATETVLEQASLICKDLTEES